MRIPPQAKLKFRGKIFEVWQWPQKMFDGSTEIFEMLKRPDTVQIIATQGNQILFTSEIQPRHKRAVGLLGGRVDPGETSLACAKRELLEESGMASKNWKLYKVYEPHVKIDWKIYYYVAQNCQRVAKPRWDAGEKIRLLKVSLKKFIDIFSSGQQHAGEFAADMLRIKYNAHEEKKFQNFLFSRKP